MFYFNSTRVGFLNCLFFSANCDDLKLDKEICKLVCTEVFGAAQKCPTECNFCTGNLYDQ